MMNSQSMQTLVNPVCQGKMPLFDRTIASTGLSKPQNMSDFLGNQMLQYSGAYFAHDPRGKDGAQVTPPWSNSKTSLLDGRNLVSHLSGMNGQNHIIYRQDSNSSEEGRPHSSTPHHAPVKQGFTLYTKSPGIISPTPATSLAYSKQKNGVHNSSPSTENSVYLAIPKPVYGHNPCCNELGCLIGQRYSVDHGSQRIPNTVYEHEWMQTDAHYTERPPNHRKAQDALLQQRGLQFESSAEPLRRIPAETYSPDRARTLPAMIEPSYGSYPCSHTRTLFGPLSEQSQRLQTSPRVFPSIYPSHPPQTFEHMTSEVYQEHSPMSKYGQLTQHPMFYYPHANVEVENRTQYKDTGSKQREDGPIILKHTISNPREHYVVPQSLHGEIHLPLPNTETLPNHSFMRVFDYPCYADPRFNLNSSQIRPTLKIQHASASLHSNRINVSPPSQYMDHHMVSASDLQKERPKTRLHVDPSHTSLPFLHFDQRSPIRRMNQPDISPSCTQVNRFFPPHTSVHIDQSALPPTSLSMDFSSCKAQVRCPKEPKAIAVSIACMPHSPHHSSGQVQTASANNANVRRIIHSPVSPANKCNGPISSPGALKGCLKRSISDSSTPIKIKKEDQDLYEGELINKRQKVEIENVGNNTKSPPMPVIDNVFSLAPYQAYLQASGVLFPGKVPWTPLQSFEHNEIKTKSDIKEKRQEGNEELPIVCQVSEEMCANATPERPVATICELKNIKVENEDISDTENSSERDCCQRDCSKVVIKKDPEETGSSNCGHMLVIKKCEPDELESKPSLADENENSAECKPGEESAQMNLSPQGDTYTQHTEQVLILQPKSITPPQLPERKIHFKHIPPQCLKLANYKIVLPETKHSSPVPSHERASAQPTAEVPPKLELQMPVRKHFFELHQSLYKLVSKSVSASSEQELRTWLSQVELTEPASPSTKAQKVSCLLGVKAREVWINDEIQSALHKLLERLREYTTQERCPFPHVMRTGAVFLPMLVVKELLFPTVQGNFIDQVLQEHKVELRPTTLSEEKILIQLHKRACSSKLRRLMSLKHLPDIYADAVNLLYYTCVCKHLELEVDNPATREIDEGCEETISCSSPILYDITASPALPSESPPLKHPTDQETKTHLNRSRTKSRVKSSSRRMFLDNSLSDEEGEDDTGKTVTGVVLNAFNKNQSDHQSEGTGTGGKDGVNAEQDSSPISPNQTLENSWTCPLTLDELSPFPSDPETEEPSSLQPGSQFKGPAKSAVRSNNCSGMILKLRRMLSEGLNRKKAHYQAISESGTFSDLSPSQADDGGKEVSSELDLHRRTPRVTHRWQRTGSFSHALRPLSNSSKRKHRSLLKIKYCPYLSACHSAEHRRRWVLRSAVQRAQRAMRFYYPDLVGKRISHLYEEDDKSEVWYRGEVLRIHEAHTNPLKTIFEVRYDSEPEWKYYLELLIDYKKGWLKIED